MWCSQALELLVQFRGVHVTLSIGNTGIVGLSTLGSISGGFFSEAGLWSSKFD